MDWLRSGLTDMVVTDLSQSPNVEVLSTDRLVQILGSMRRLDDRVVSFDTVQEIARRARVQTVLVGSYVKAGEAIRINAKLQDAATGRIISSERVDAQNESVLFATIDDLTRRIKARFTPAGGNPATGLLFRPDAAAGATDVVSDRDLKDVTTSSIDAYRYYAEAIDLHYRARYAEALPLMEKATQIDPTFALAFAKLAILHFNLGHSNESDRYAKRALDGSQRLTPRERLYIEGVHYSNRPDTVAKAIDAYSRNLELYPTHPASRNNLALMLLQLERFDEAIAQYAILQRQGYEFQGMVSTFSSAYFSAGQPDKGFDVIHQFINRQPTSEASHASLGTALLSVGRLDEATAAIDKAESLSPGLAAERESRRLSESTEPNRQIAGHLIQAAISLYQGKSRQALDTLLRGGTVQPGSNEAANVRNVEAELLLELGRPADALKEARQALTDAAGRGAAFTATQLTALAQSRLGHTAEAAAAGEALAQMANVTPSDRDKRGVRLLNGVLALDRRDSARAVAELAQAEGMLPRGPLGAGAGTGFGQPRQPAVPVRFALGRAYLQAGQDSQAAERFRAIAEGGFLRLLTPVEFVRSLYHLGEIAERQGDRAAARDYYGRFLRYWKDGDIDRDHVAEATRKLAS